MSADRAPLPIGMVSAKGRTGTSDLSVVAELESQFFPASHIP